MPDADAPRPPSPRPVTSRRGAAETGAIALLLPAAVLVLLVLGAIAVDLALTQGAQRRLVDLAGTVATDAVGQIDVDAALGGAAATLDPAGAQALADANAAVVTAGDARLDEVACDVAATGDEVVVTCTGTVSPIIGAALPGVGPRTVTGVDTARPAATVGG